MRIARSNRFNLNPKEKKALARMARDGILIDDMEEGEISDTSSVEEISEEDFKQDVRVSKPSSGDARIWMGDMYKYPVSSTYASGLYNLAWAQAVQNKSLDEILVRDFGLDAEKSKRSSSKLLANCREDNNKTLSPSKEDCKEIIDISGEEIDSKMGDNVIGDEKEEGELEEGEIDLDSEMIEETQEGIANDNLPTIASEIDSNPSEMDVNESEFDRQIKLIREKLGTVTVEDAEKSFHSVCSQLQKSLESFNLLIMKNRFLSIDFLIEPLFTAIQIIISVFRSMDSIQQEQNGDILSRLLALVKNQDPAAFSSEQMRQIEAVLSSLDAEALLSSTKNMKKEGSRLGSGVNMNNSGALVENPAHDFSPSKKPHLEPLFVNLSDLNDENMGSEASNLRMSSGSKGKVHFGPILDLHRDHDADSLPSPTREAPMPLSVQKSLDVEDKAVRPSLTVTAIVEKPEDKTMHPYETDALKAVSTYQQKFGWTPYFSSNKLPSPTPSEECNDGDGDSDEEFSSHSTVSDIRTTNSPIPLQSTCSDTQNVDSLKAQGLVPAKNVGQIGSVPNHVLKASAKSRDPRLRFANTEVATVDLSQRPQFVDSNPPKTDPLGGNSRKHKILEESLLDDHKLKKQRNGLTNSGISMDVQKVSGIGTGTGGWLDDGKAVSQFMERSHLVGNRGADAGTLENGRAISGKRQEIGNGTGNINVTVDGIKQLTVDDPGNKISLPSLLKDIAVNPTMLMSLIKMEQQRLATEAQKKSGDPAQNMSHPSSLNAISGTVPFANSLSSNTLELQQKPIGKPHASSQIDLMKQGDLGNIRMKPRDPRRVLHNGTFQKSNYLRSGQSKTNGAPSLITQGSKDNLVVRQQGEQAEINPMPSQSTTLPDISGQFTKGLKNLADMLSASQTTNTFPVPLDDSTQPILLKTDKADAKVVADLTDQQSGTGLMPEEGAGNPCHSQNVWGDLEHLFEGYDDQQKAAIQRERARRMEEQSKMFAARKLCLVLDLDHTLLNSAKFVEVDAVHEEILRKKEEQDREKPERHLFRFSHMGMWTKLRPGIWNFLEKASKLYELHLYTMGNKLYATEMAKVLDPTGMLFAGRVISKGDDGDPFDGDDRVPKSKDLDGVLGMESDVVIIDDSVRVWPHNKLNLIVVERYTYFPCSRRQFGLLGPSLLEIDHDERPEDGTLASALSVIERIHQNFFSNRSLEDVDVRNILASEQRKILAGCRIVFSRVFPVGEANPQLHPLWQTAEQFGAVCTNQIDEHVTHVVANSLGTDKVNWALTTGRFVVHPGWVEASALLYRKANEHDFAVKL